MNYPSKVKIEDKEYPIDTDFRIAIECNSIAMDTEIGDYERALAIIYKLFGDKGLEDKQNHCKLLELAQKYLLCGKELNQDIKQDEIDMDFEQDMDYIEASFMSDYNIDLANTEMHWWKFYNLMNGLSNSEMGNCCVLNRVRNLRNYDTSEIKDVKERTKIEEAKQKVALKKKVKPLTKEQQESAERFNKLAGIS
jgi:hypothetical protein